MKHSTVDPSAIQSILKLRQGQKSSEKKKTESLITSPSDFKVNTRYVSKQTSPPILDEEKEEQEIPK